MLSKIRRKFHAVKYLFNIEVQCLTPWPSDDKPVSVFWQRGHKKSKRGQTQPQMPFSMDGQMKTAIVTIAQTITLTATLYSESKKTKLTGPYQKKICKLFVMQMDNDGEMLAMLGKAELDLAAIASPQETTIELPLDCDQDIRKAVGVPKLILTCRVGDSRNPPPLPDPKPHPTTGSEKAQIANQGTISDPSTMSSDPIKSRRPGTLTVEQESSLEGFDRSSGILGSIQEIASPNPEEERNVADSVEDMETNAKAPSDHPSGENPPAKIPDVVLSSITEEIDVPEEPTAKTDKHDDDDGKTALEDSAHGDSNDNSDAEIKGNAKDTLEVTSMLDKWSTGKGVVHTKQSSEANHLHFEPAFGGALGEWWSVFVSLLTCTPARPKDD